MDCNEPNSANYHKHLKIRKQSKVNEKFICNLRFGKFLLTGVKHDGIGYITVVVIYSHGTPGQLHRLVHVEGVGCPAHA